MHGRDAATAATRGYLRHRGRACDARDAKLKVDICAIVLEILEDIEPDAEVQARCAELDKAGFKIALDDWVFEDPREELLRWASVVKVDLPSVEEKNLRRLVRSLRRKPLRLLRSPPWCGGCKNC